MQRILALILVTVFGLTASIESVEAGSRARSKFVEGAIIGAGAAILGATIVAEINRDSAYNRYDRYDRRDKRDRCDRQDKYDRHDRRDRGYWSVERVWIEPVYVKKWLPGFYNRKGRWIQGGYDRILVREGYWESKRIWVRN
ncbi:MAG: hypothetical protein HQK68_09765 [Desulfamplus sp.]|nr:hypothetical protein [Desulfamplus sp.]